MNTCVDLKTTRRILGGAAKASSLLEMKQGQVSCEEWREQVRLHHKQEKGGEDSIWEEVCDTSRMALVLVRDWERRALIMAHKPAAPGLEL